MIFSILTHVNLWRSMHCSVVTALKEQSLERVFRTWRNCCRDSPGSCLRVARWRANTLFLVLTYTRLNSATAASYISQSSIFWYTEGVRKLTRSPRRFTPSLGPIAACTLKEHFAVLHYETASTTQQPRDEHRGTIKDCKIAGATTWQGRGNQNHAFTTGGLCTKHRQSQNQTKTS